MIKFLGTGYWVLGKTKLHLASTTQSQEPSTRYLIVKKHKLPIYQVQTLKFRDNKLRHYVTSSSSN